MDIDTSASHDLLKVKKSNMQEFKKGDKVRLLNHDIIGWEESTWTKDAKLKIGEIYTIDIVDYSIAEMPCVFLEEDRIFDRPGYALHPEHFELVSDVQTVELPK